MAKVRGPLFSVGARGKFAGAMVFSFWKGVNVVRELVIPANPQTAAQGDQREMLGGLGRSVKYVQAESPFEGYGKAVAPTGQSWISYYIKWIMLNKFASRANYVTQWDAWQAHAEQVSFTDDAETLGLTELNIAYKGDSNHFYPGLQLYMIAVYGREQYLLDNTKFNAAPYNTALAGWDGADIDLLVADFAAP